MPSPRRRLPAARIVATVHSSSARRHAAGHQSSSSNSPCREDTPVQERRLNSLLETDFSLCVSKFPESFSNSTQGNSYFLNGYSKTHMEIAVHTRKFIFSCRLPQNSQGKFRTHWEIHIFFVGCEKRTGQLLNTQGNPYFLCRLQ